MKSLDKYYSKEFRHNLSYFPVWQPGDPIKPGEIGRIEHGVFFPEGPVTSLFSELSFNVKKKKATASMSFYSDSGISVSSGVTGSQPLKGGGSMRISFSCVGGTVFHADKLTLHYIENLNTLIRIIEGLREKWPKGLVIVTHVEIAERYAVLISKSKSWDVGLKGEISALDSLHIADASVSLATIKGAGYERTGTGPVALRIYGFKSKGTRPRLLSIEEKITAESPFNEISPFDPSFEISVKE